MTESRIAVVIGRAGSIRSEISRALERGGGRVVVADVDLGGTEAEQSIAELFETVEMQQGPVATLVYIAGGAPLDPGVRPLIATTTLDAWIETGAWNSRGAFLCVREFLRRWTPSAVSDARIVTVTSADATGKEGVLALTRIASLEAAPMGITVNAVVPGTIDTPASDVAATVCFLSSAAAGHITGAAIAVDGGLRLSR